MKGFWFCWPSTLQAGQFPTCSLMNPCDFSESRLRVSSSSSLLFLNTCCPCCFCCPQDISFSLYFIILGVIYQRIYLVMLIGIYQPLFQGSYSIKLRPHNPKIQNNVIMLSLLVQWMIKEKRNKFSNSTAKEQKMKTIHPLPEIPQQLSQSPQVLGQVLQSECRICGRMDGVTNLLQPCACNSLVHRACILGWVLTRMQSGKEDRRSRVDYSQLVCEECGFRLLIARTTTCSLNVLSLFHPRHRSEWEKQQYCLLILSILMIGLLVLIALFPEVDILLAIFLLLFAISGLVYVLATMGRRVVSRVRVLGIQGFTGHARHK